MGAHDLPGRGAPVLLLSIAVGSVGAVLVWASGPFWMPRLMPDGGPLLGLAIGLAVLLYSGHVGLAGATSGLEKWGTYSALSATEALIRLAAIAGAAFLAGGLAGLEFAALTGTLVWLFFALITSGGREGALARADVGIRVYLVQCAFAIATATASAVLITGFPAVIKLLADPADFAKAAPLLLAVSLTRAPIMIPLQAFQGVAITSLIQSSRSSYEVLAKPFVAIVGLGLGGGALAALIGPYIMLIFGTSYQLDGWILGVLTLDAALLAILTLTGTAAMALGRHKLYLSGWLVATAVATLILLLPAPLTNTVVIGLAAGPVAGAAVHAAGILRPARKLRSAIPSSEGDRR